MSRLTSDFWIAAYRQRLTLHAVPCVLTRKGDATAGAILIKICTMDGQARVFHRQVDLLSGGRQWVVLVEGEEATCDASIEKQCGFDPDLWVLEVEDPQGRHFLDEPGLAE